MDRREQERKLMDAISAARKAATEGTLRQEPMSPREEFLSKLNQTATEVASPRGRVPALIPKPVLGRLRRAVEDKTEQMRRGMVVGMPTITLDMADVIAILASAQGGE